MKLNVLFENESRKTIVSYFGGPQDESVYQNAGVILTSDSRWKAFYEALPEQAKVGVPAPTSKDASDLPTDRVDGNT
ncbi:hypothetical protein BDI4_70069 [Burkholderia diffusa]|uniref:hypothetical protein n=1 Tax=Burkholderia diffusa TaxID=488732 RepID=UPI001CAAFCB1|nr:hypothetical protein [Burkholderia diffusa]CAG9262099.1 hypothetical protein BDI4_70069 [Burkholderia diffusa]